MEKITRLPDLLNAEPRAVKEQKEIRDKLQFAFSSGESGGGLRMSLAGYEVSSSDWRSDCFAEDLFVDDLVESCFQIKADHFGDDYRPPQNLAYFKKVLLHPPRALESVLFRQEIQKELQRAPEVRGRFLAVYRWLTELREELDSPGVMGWEYSTRRRIDLLLRIRETVDRLAEEFSTASSGIKRIRAWAREFQRSEGYTLLRDFVDYEGRLSEVQLQFRVGVDGTMRGLKILRLSENTGSRFYQSPVVRLWSLFSMFMRGYKVGRDELVARIVERVFDSIDDSLSYFLVLIGHMEFHLAALSFRELCEARGMATSFPVFANDGGGRALRGLFNPLLLKQEGGPVPCDLECQRSDTMMVITGPNSGGKTRLLQSLGLLQLLGQGGMVVPAREATIPIRSGLFLSLIQNSTADQEEGRLGMELLRIKRVFERTPRGALIILDELCSGTNPSEGEEIILLVISLLRELDAEVFMTTHFLRFAEQLAKQHDQLRLEFKQVQLDAREEPTYQFTPGVATTSLAGRTARRLGVTREHLLSLMGEESVEPSPRRGTRAAAVTHSLHDSAPA